MDGMAVPATGFSGTVGAEVLAFEPGGRGTRLFLTHEGFDPDDPVQRRARGIMGGGRRTAVLRPLQAVLDEM
ncbi:MULTISPECIES: hypothetical protein [Actinomadura]|uniref:Uncharacterized protein n=1 Tax=Actinomadura yumaensis TaxID=111807 RepID=A0ABW2CJ96_9ACTN|nr:hypothetical protein [Actinomadura sp. J1-007]